MPPRLKLWGWQGKACQKTPCHSLYWTPLFLSYQWWQCKLSLKTLERNCSITCICPLVQTSHSHVLASVLGVALGQELFCRQGRLLEAPKAGQWLITSSTHIFILKKVSGMTEHLPHMHKDKGSVPLLQKPTHAKMKVFVEPQRAWLPEALSIVSLTQAKEIEWYMKPPSFCFWKCAPNTLQLPCLQV